MADHVSASQLVMFQRCAEQWRRRFIEREFMPPALPVRIGQAVREAVLLCLHRRLDTGTGLPPEDLLDAAADIYMRRLSEGVYFAPEDLSSARAAMASGKDTVLALTSLFRRELAPALFPALVEGRALLDLGLAVPVSVSVDCLTVSGEARHFATASRRWNADRIHAAPDPALRREAVRRLTGNAPERLLVDVLVGARTPVIQSLETSRAPGDLMKVIRAFRLMLASVSAGIFPPAAPESPLCSPRWCCCFYTCPYVPAHRRVLPVGVHGAGATLSSVAP